MNGYISFISLTLLVVAGSLTEAKPTRGPADRTYTECDDDGTCSQVQEWEYRTESVDVGNRVDSSNSYNVYSSSNTNTNINADWNSNTNTNSGNNNYNYHYYNDVDGYWYDGVWYTYDDNSESITNAPTTTTTTSAPIIRPIAGHGSGFGRGENRHRGGSFIGDMIRLPGRVAGGFVDEVTLGGNIGGAISGAVDETISGGIGGAMGGAGGFGIGFNSLLI